MASGVSFILHCIMEKVLVKQRIAKGAGVDIAEVNRIVKQFEQSKKLMKQLPGMMGGGKRKGLGGLGGMLGKMKLPF